MRFGRAVFIIAGIWGLLVLTPLYFSTASIGGMHPSPTTDPLFYYGFLAVTMAWQVAFLVIGSNPIRYRPLMVPAMLEKFIYIASVGVLYAHGRVATSDVLVTTPDGVLGLLFVAAFVRTRAV